MCYDGRYTRTHHSKRAEASAVPAVRLNDPRRVDSQRRRHSPHTTHASRGVCSFARQTSTYVVINISAACRVGARTLHASWPR